MATKQNDTTPFNSLDLAKSVIMESLHTRVDPSKFRNEAEVEKFISSQFKHLMKLGNYSYDPTLGEIIISFPASLNVFHKLPDERQVSTIMHDYFTNQGWQSVIIIPGRTGAHCAMVRLKHVMITATELTNQGSRVERAIESALTH